ncbi:MAG: NrpR regulatory domain-containing protein [Thermodesulfobacteriota bacterium]|nr:NrpR regulatory domain-containing protein [Thermodesulfobacteriota bacterium]
MKSSNSHKTMIPEVEKKIVSILRVLKESREPVGARVLSRKLQEFGVNLSERAVRYHLKIMDEKGLTTLEGKRNGRVITKQGIDEIKNARVGDKIGFAISRIEILSFKTTFDPEKKRGLIPVNISLFPREKFKRALKAMKPAFFKGICISDFIAVAHEGEKLGDITVPEGNVGLATVCSIIINGTLLKAGIPMDSRFGGILQVKDKRPLRFVELIHYTGSSLDPSEAFIRGKMTSVRDVVKKGEGKILANFREIPSICYTLVEEVLEKLKGAGIGGIIMIGDVSEPVCEIPVDLNKAGMILAGGLNPVAYVQEMGIESENLAMSTLIDYGKMIRYPEFLKEFSP